MYLSFSTLLSAIFLCAANTAMAGAPGKCDHNGPAGTTLVETFQMYTATVSIYQKTTMISSKPPSRRLRMRRQILTANPAIGNEEGAEHSKNITSTYNPDLYNSTDLTNSTGALNSTGSNNYTGPDNSYPFNNTTPLTINYTTIDMTPAEPTSWDCYAGSFQQPSLADCDVVIAAQLYNSTGSLTAYPGTYVFVSYGNCVTVFQNPEPSEYSLQYNWAELGSMAQKIKTSCLAPQLNNIGGAGIFENYLDYTLKDVLVSLQRYDSDPIPAPAQNASSFPNQ